MERYGYVIEETDPVRASCGLSTRYTPPERLLTPSGTIPAVFQRRRVSPVAMVHPVVVVSPGVDMLAGSWVALVSPVLAMRWSSFVHKRLKFSNRTNRV
jgi:hypothetical protein